MSTYAIADAIGKFAENFKYAVHAINEKNKIERERLEFEKEKFEFSKQRLGNKQQPETSDKENGNCCDHHWRYMSTEFDQINMCYVRKYACAYCGETKTEELDCLSTT